MATVLDLKAFGAGFATISSAPMFNIDGVTPEAAAIQADMDSLEDVKINLEDLRQTWRQLNTAEEPHVALVSLGFPHFALKDFARLVELCKGLKKRDEVCAVITTSQHVYSRAAQEGFLDKVGAFGALPIPDA